MLKSKRQISSVKYVKNNDCKQQQVFYLFY